MAFLRWINIISLILYVLATGLTVSYKLRLIYFRLRGVWILSSLTNVRDEESVITNSITVLGFRAVIIGAILVNFPWALHNLFIYGYKNLSSFNQAGRGSDRVYTKFDEY